MKITFLLAEPIARGVLVGSKLVVRRLCPAPAWADGERLYGRVGGIFGLGGTQVLLYFEGSARLGKLVAIWKTHRRSGRSCPRVRIWPPPATQRSDGCVH